MNHIPLKVDKEDIETAFGQVGESPLVETEVANKGSVTTTDNESSDEVDEKGREGSETNSGLPGVDKVLSAVKEKLGDNYHEVVKGLQRNMVQSGQVESERRQLRDALDRVEALEEALEEDDEEDAPDFSNVDPGQLEILEAYLREQGNVKQAELSEQERDKASNDSNLKGVDRFGEDFGYVDDETGEFVVNQENKERMSPVYDRLVNNQQLDFQDLHILANFPSLQESRYQQGRNDAITEIRDMNTKRVSEAQRSTGVATMNSGGETRSVVYDRENNKKNGVGGFKAISETMKNVRRALNP